MTTAGLAMSEPPFVTPRHTAPRTALQRDPAFLSRSIAGEPEIRITESLSASYGVDIGGAIRMSAFRRITPAVPPGADVAGAVVDSRL